MILTLVRASKHGQYASVLREFLHLVSQKENNNFKLEIKKYINIKLKKKLKKKILNEMKSKIKLSHW